jgi:FG-GAP-like repeat/Glycosyl hydrolases family 16
MSRNGQRTADTMDWSEQDSGTWRSLVARCVMLTLLLAGILLLGIVSVAVNVAQAEPLPNGVPGTWALLLNEEFSANGLNTALWTPEWPSGPMSGQCTSPSLVSQPGNGYLYLQVKAQESTCGGTKHPDTGSLVESNPADGKPGHSGFLYSYGYVEWRVYIVGWGGEAQGCPKGGCIPDWPALWSFPENEENEIDTMEGLHGKACHTWHHHVSPIEETQGCQSGSYAGWHTYGVDWEPGVLTFYYDGAKVGEEVKSGYINSTPQYLIMDDVPPGSYGGELVVPDEIVVDYVRVWQHPSRPTVSTGAASHVEFKRALLGGSVNPNGGLTEYYYQYGLTNSYGAETSKGTASGWATVSAPLVVTGLQLGTTYHFRLVATNPEGTSYGGDEKFTTAAPPTLSISDPTQSSLTLSWTASANASSYTIMRNGESVGSTSELTYTDKNLHSATFYHYEVIANEEGESAKSNEITRATTLSSSLVADFNGDGRTDLGYIYPGGYIDTFLSIGNGTYEKKAEQVSKEFNSVSGTWEVGDFNGDGKTDLVYITANYIDTFLSKGNGTYEEKQEEVSKEFNSVSGTWEVGDFNGDGKTDLVYITANYIDTFLSKGNGTYEEKQEEVSKEFNSVSGQWRIGDFNHDGKTDLVYIVSGGYLDTFLSNGNGTYEEKQELIESGFNIVSGLWL